MKSVLFFLSAILISNYSFSQDKLTADAGKTTLEWKGEKVLGSHTGTVNLKSGWLTFGDNQVKGGEFLIDMPTIKTPDNNQKLEGHLKSDDFFGVEKYPVSKLVITGSTPFDKGTAVVSGQLTIKDITNPVEFKATIQKKDDGTWFYSRITIDRTKYNIRYGSGSFFENLGDKTIYDEFEIKVSLLVN